MMNWREKVFFDPGDHALVDLVAGKNCGDGSLPGKFASELHPRGILELVEPRSFRIVRSVMTLLENFTPGPESVSRRLSALTLLRDELCEGLNVPLKKNTARLLPELAKELIRVRHDSGTALRAAHDLRIALLGNPRFIRKQLKRFQLIEMPEKADPVTFDYHVHDVNTKGRKSPSHLIMDAWIKGIRRIQVIFYNQVPHEAAFELMSSAAIMGIDVRIGIEFRVVHRRRFAELIWSPSGFSGADDLLNFLKRKNNREFNARCEEAALYHTSLIFGMLRRFNAAGRIGINRFYKIGLAPLSDGEFSAFLPPGRRPSTAHAAEFIESRVRKLLEEELQQIEKSTEPSGEDLKRLELLRQHLNTLTPGVIRNNYLEQKLRDEVPENIADLPALMRLSPRELACELRGQSRAFRLTLNLTGLSLADVIEILFECRGDITALEIFNLKDHLRRLDRSNTLINDLRHALNTGNVVNLKNIVFKAVEEVKSSGDPDRESVIMSLRMILRKLPEFAGFYARSPLKAALGSDSAGKAALAGSGAGMGLAVLDTLDRRVRAAVSRKKSTVVLPVRSSVFKQISFLPSRRFAPAVEQIRWQCSDPAELMGRNGNLISLGLHRNVLHKSRFSSWWEKAENKFHFLNSDLKIILKVAAGFLAAFLTFFFSGSWWVLAWFGAPIWLGITLIRNMIQFRAASGTFRASPLLKWNEFISWQRISDSLFFTGLSVPLLDFVVRNLIMRQCFGVTTENDPLLLYSVMGLANGLYITTHNLLRALPGQAILGNWLRVPLAIPIAFAINAFLTGVLNFCGLAGAGFMLQQWAAVISKFSSDCVGGIVEALADRALFIRSRMGDFKRKQQDLFKLISDLELTAPDTELSVLLRKNTLFERSSVRESPLIARILLNALDLMYIWMRQPRAPQVIGRMVKSSTREERLLYVAIQQQLNREEEISELLNTGLPPESAARVLGFYRKAWKLYLSETAALFPEQKK